MQRRVGYVPGVYDMFHIGHLNILRNAKQRCDYLIAGVVTDDVVRQVKKKAPVVPLFERMEIVGSMACVDEVVADWSSDKFDMWKQLKFDIFFKGDDWKGTVKGARLERLFAEVGVDVVYFPYTPHTSSTRLRALIADPA